MEAFRLSKLAYAGTLSGYGAALNGARWNSKGTEIIYTAANRSLAMAEVAVHLSLATIPPDFMMVSIYIPDDISLLRLNTADLPTDWNIFPHPPTTQVIGDKFIADNKYCILQIPSSVTQGDYNLLINPHHSEFSKIQITDTVKFIFDQRLFH